MLRYGLNTCEIIYVMVSVRIRGHVRSWCYTFLAWIFMLSLVWYIEGHGKHPYIHICRTYWVKKKKLFVFKIVQ